MIYLTRATLLLGLVACLGAGPATEVIPGVTLETQSAQSIDNPLHVLRIDLVKKQLTLRVVPGGGISDGEGGKWQTTLETVPKVAEREGFVAAINGDFFEFEQPPAGDELAALTQRRYRAGARARVIGSAVTDGRQWATAPAKRPGLVVREGGGVSIEEVDKAPAGVRQLVTGNMWLVHRGTPMAYPPEDRTALTGVGIDREGNVLMFVVADGLAGGKAGGVTIPELAKELARLGCWNAFLLDGGGSSTMVVRDKETGKMKVVNRPTDGRARAVASVVGVKGE